VETVIKETVDRKRRRKKGGKIPPQKDQTEERNFGLPGLGLDGGGCGGTKKKTLSLIIGACVGDRANPMETSGDSRGTET